MDRDCCTHPNAPGSGRGPGRGASRRIWIASTAVALAVVLVGVGAGVAANPSAPRFRLADDTVLTVEATVLAGQKPRFSPGFWLRPWLQRGTRWSQEPIWGGGDLRERPAILPLEVWLTRTGRKADTHGFVRALLCDEAGEIVSEQFDPHMELSFPELVSPGPAWMPCRIRGYTVARAWGFRYLPRRSRVLRIRILPVTGGPGAMPLGEIRLPNPLFGTFPRWEAQLLPARCQTEQFMVTLRDARQIQDLRRSGPGIGFLRLGFEVENRGGTSGEWVPRTIRITDAVGNCYTYYDGGWAPVTLRPDGRYEVRLRARPLGSEELRLEVRFIHNNKSRSDEVPVEFVVRPPRSG